MLTKSMKKKVNISVSIIIFALWFIGHSAFAVENVSFKGTTKLANGGFVTLTGKLTKPQGDGPFPAVILMHGCAGITGDIDTWADRLANWGYVAIVLDSFGPRGEINICERIMAIPFNVRSQDAYDAKSYLSGKAFVDRNRMAAIGFSHGGISTLCVASVLSQLRLYND